MCRFFVAYLHRIMLLSILAVLTGAGPAHATTYDFYAFSLYSGMISDFSLPYRDENGDERFSMTSDVLIAGTYSGYYWYGIFHDRAEFVSVLVSVPGTAYVPLTDGSGATWVGDGAKGRYFTDYKFWSYSQTPVPLPPTVLLFGSGLLGLAGWRRFRKG